MKNDSSVIIEHIQKVESDRDYWKNRAEALERAVQGDCGVCENAGECEKYPCYCINGNAWKFDMEHHYRMKAGEPNE